MDNIKPILEKLGLTEDGIQHMQAEVRKAAIDCGKSLGKNYQLSSADWNMLDDISDMIWYSQMSITDKIKVGFEFFSQLPSYYHGLVPIYHVIKDNVLDKKLLNFVCNELSYYLSSNEKYYSDSVEYVLWVDFFEDEQTCALAWRGIINSEILTAKGEENLLNCCGPVAYDLKESLYLKLFKNKKMHSRILYSLAHSAVDAYGKLDKIKAGKLLSKLSIDKNDSAYHAVYKAINNR